MSKSTKEYLQHILIEINYLIKSSQGIPLKDLLSNETLMRAFARSIEIIGEASKQIPEDFRAQYPDIDWKAMAGMRDRLIHHYFGVDYEIVWDVVTQEIPALKLKLETLIPSIKT